MYVKLENSYAYVDFCEYENVHEHKFSPKYLNTKTLQHSSINCKSQIAENDEVFWAGVPVSFNQFQCARLLDEKNTACTSYAIKFGNVSVKLDVDCLQNWSEPLGKIEIRQYAKSSTVLRGLCGTIDSTCATYTDSSLVCQENVKTLFDYWK